MEIFFKNTLDYWIAGAHKKKIHKEKNISGRTYNTLNYKKQSRDLVWFTSHFGMFHFVLCFPFLDLTINKYLTLKRLNKRCWIFWNTQTTANEKEKKKKFPSWMTRIVIYCCSAFSASDLFAQLQLYFR